MDEFDREFLMDEDEEEVGPTDEELEDEELEESTDLTEGGDSF